MKYLVDLAPDLRLADEDYGKLLKTVKLSSTGAQVYHLLKLRGAADKFPSSFLNRLYVIYEASFMQSLLIRHETNALLKEFDQRGIPVIPLKGTWLAERYFGHFSARGTSDIDLLVRPQDMDTATACIAERGFVSRQPVNPAHYHTEWHKPAPSLPEPLTVELHWSLVPAGTSRLNVEDAWAASEPLPDYGSVRLFNPTYTFYALCLHGVSHQMESLKPVLDLLWFIRLNGAAIDWRELWRQAAKDRTRRRVEIALASLLELFPELASEVSLPHKPLFFYWNKSEVLQPRERRQRLTRLPGKTLYDLVALDNWRYRTSYVVRKLLPSRELARYSLDAGGRESPLPVVYYRLYKQRLRKIFGGV